MRPSPCTPSLLSSARSRRRCRGPSRPRRPSRPNGKIPALGHVGGRGVLVGAKQVVHHLHAGPIGRIGRGAVLYEGAAGCEGLEEQADGRLRGQAASRRRCPGRTCR
eukprot:16283728-Heterocapsa_arctica.AAC.1